jgi:amino acid transporter
LASTSAANTNFISDFASPPSSPSNLQLESTEKQSKMAPQHTVYGSLQSPTADPALVSRAINLRRRKIEIDVPEGTSAALGPTWMYPSGGSAEHVQVPAEALEAIEEKLRQPRHLLSEWFATSISGNDILSSVLYAASSVALKAGKLMPIPLLMVAIVLYFFRFIYEEVVTAIPMNGGTYNALLNTTSKRTAAFAATLSILAYIATGVVSATSGISYISNVVEMPLVGCTIALLLVFAVLNVVGISESSRVALVIFVHHIIVLSILLVSCVVYWIKHPDVFSDNMKVGYPTVDFAGSDLDGNVFTAIFFGFGAAMLGVTGFESSSNYVEEQQPGVFRKTLRNMWAFAAVFNVGLGITIMAVLPFEGEEGIYENADALLAKVASVAVGRWLEVWVCIDALVVLAGAVLTSYVGICGLVSRLAADRVLPQFLAKKNKLRGTAHWIILLYFLLASSLVLILNGDATTVNGVYTYAFLGLMGLFSCGCMLLKAKRSEIPRDVHAPWHVVIFGFLMILIGLFANLLGDPKVLMYFALYFIVVISVIFVMFERVTILRVVLAVLKQVAPSRHKEFSSTLASGDVHTGARGGRTITKAIMNINEAPVVFFCKVPDLTIINKAIIYVRRNEQTHNLRIVHVYKDEEGDAPVLKVFEEMVALFDAIYPKIRIDFVSVHGEFNAALIEWTAQSMEIPKSLMFITQPDLLSAERVSTSGIRVITA